MSAAADPATMSAADLQAPTSNGSQARRGLPGRSIAGLVALGAVGVFGAISWYAYDRGRLTTAPPPVVSAKPGPIRVLPEQPGGLQVPHLNRLILDRSAGRDDNSEPVVERLLPRAEKPIERVPVAPPAAADSLPSVPGQTDAGEDTAGTGLSETAEPDDATGAGTATAAELPPLPMRRPAWSVKPAAAPPAAPVPAATPSERYRVQLGAFREEATARATWGRLQKAFAEQLGSLTLSVEQASTAEKGTFYRIQGGPVDEESAREICAVLTMGQQGCIVVER